MELSGVGKRLFCIFLIVFLGAAGFSLPFPLFSPMALDPNYHFLPIAYTKMARAIYLGVLLSMYPLGQLFGCPFFGQLSDRFGRKKILLITLILTFFSYLITALAVSMSSPYFLIFARFFCGVFEGNIVIANSAIADLSTENTKSKNFGYITVGASLGWIVGPILGGLLADPKHVSWFNFSTPFWTVSLLVLFTFIVVLLWFQETLVFGEKEKMRVRHVFANMYKGLIYPQLFPVYIINFLLYFGAFCYFNFLPLFLYEKFSFGPTYLAWITAYEAVPICIASLFIVGPLAKTMSARMATAISSIFFGVTLYILILPKDPYALLITTFFIGLCLGINFTNMTVMVSNRIDNESQGMALGINQSVQVLSEVASGFVGGLLAGIYMTYPLIAGAIVTTLSACAIFLPRFKRIY